MIAVTKAAADRGWVAIRPDLDGLAGLDQHPAELWLGTTVAVVEPMIGSDVNGNWLRGWRLTGFANVAEVLPIHEPAGTEPCGIYPDTKHICIEAGATYLLDGINDNDIDLPHAEPGGLALRLEPIVGRISSRLHNRLYEPVTVVDWSGELGRWDR